MTPILSEEVLDTQESGGPLVALESTIISHGFPWPDNLDLALALEAAVRAHGATPATIAVIDGVPRVGLGRDDLERLARADRVEKCSARDLPFVCATGRTGATTVAATCLLADRAGIPVFATGGIGGVHRGATLTMDVSADLAEIARARVAVVSAGAKSILDLALTLEALETLGGPIVGFGCDELPAFYTPHSGLPIPHRVDDLDTLARIVAAHRSLGLHGGLLIFNPIPPAHALPADRVDAWIAQALEAAQARQIEGKALTPFLLAELARLSNGATLPANRALALHNADLAARLALRIAALDVPALDGHS